MMEIKEVLNDYYNLLRDMDYIKEQITLTKKEFTYWSGIKFEPGKDGIPLGSKGSFKYGTETALIQSEKKRRALERLFERLAWHEETKEKMDEIMSKFDGLERQVMYKRLVEKKTIQQIAEDLNYSEIRIKQISAKVSKLYQNYTDLLYLV